eukprot:3903990-Amphidinium_carterae.2
MARDRPLPVFISCAHVWSMVALRSDASGTERQKKVKAAYGLGSRQTCISTRTSFSPHRLFSLARLKFLAAQIGQRDNVNMQCGLYDCDKAWWQAVASRAETTSKESLPSSTKTQRTAADIRKI